MNTQRPNVLFLPAKPGEETGLYRRLMPALVSLDCQICRVPDDTSAANHVERTRYELIIAGFPIEQPQLPAFLKSVRWRKSACRRTAVLLVTDRISLRRAEQFLNRGVNRVILEEATDWELESTLTELLEVEPRISFTLPVRLDLSVGGRREQVVAQVDNLSSTGMLVRGQWMVELGAPARFEFVLPEEREPLRGTAEIVRSTVREREGISGFGLHFDSFEGEGRERLGRWLRNRPDALREVVEDVDLDSGARAG
jgi:hypothetical protein